MFFKAQHPASLYIRVLPTSRPSNLERNEWAISLLNLQPSDRVLAIGFPFGKATSPSHRTTPIDGGTKSTNWLARCSLLRHRRYRFLKLLSVSCSRLQNSSGSSPLRAKRSHSVRHSARLRRTLPLVLFGFLPSAKRQWPP